MTVYTSISLVHVRGKTPYIKDLVLTNFLLLHQFGSIRKLVSIKSLMLALACIEWQRLLRLKICQRFEDMCSCCMHTLCFSYVRITHFLLHYAMFRKFTVLHIPYNLPTNISKKSFRYCLNFTTSVNL